MSFTNPGRDAKMVLNPATGKFDLVWLATTNNPAFDDSEIHRVVSLIFEHRGEWILDTAGNRGSLLHTLKELRRSTPSAAEASVLEALERAVSEGVIDSVTVKARRVTTFGRLTLDIRWRATRGGAEQSLTVTVRT